MHTHTLMHKHTEMTEWHLNMLPWHRACRHGNSIGGRGGLWDVPLGFHSVYFPFFPSFFSDRQFLEGDWPPLLSHTVTHTELQFSRVRVEGFQTTGVSVCTLLSTPTGSTLEDLRSQHAQLLRCRINATFRGLTNDANTVLPKGARRNKGGQYSQTHLIAVRTPAIIPHSHVLTHTHMHKEKQAHTHAHTPAHAVVESVRQ